MIRMYWENKFRYIFTDILGDDTISTVKQTLVYRCSWAHIAEKDNIEYLCITSDIGSAFKDYFGIKFNKLEKLEKELGWEIRTIKLNGEPTEAIVVPLEEFYKFLYPEVEL